MAIVRMGPLVQAASGALQTVVFKHTRRGTILAHRPLKTDPVTLTQTTQRTAWRTAQLAWGALSQSQRTAWRAAARNFAQVDRLGTPRSLSGYNLFMRENAPRSLFPVGPLTEPPGETRPSAPTSFDLQPTFFNTLQAAWTAPDYTTTPYMLLYIGRTLRDQIPTHIYPQQLFAAFVATTNTYALYPVIKDTIGRPADGEYIQGTLRYFYADSYISPPAADNIAQWPTGGPP